MSNKMLIDAGHPEETRVVVLRGSRVEEFDFEAADRQQLRGNIYLAKVTRVEPSLQAAFVDYGGNRHGFLAFSEIHPDYYQIPYADRQALIQEQAQEDAESARADEAELAQADEARAETAARAKPEAVESSADGDAPAEAAGQPETEATEAEGAPSPAAEESAGDGAAAAHGENGEPEHEEDEAIESVGAEDALEEVPERRKPRPRQYKIQEVIKRRQVMLVQVVKEERGSKGAALTTYLSLAGRYSVLMPNTARGGGISRKITTPTDRKRLKEIATELEVPEGMGVILRTAGANRTKAEIKRDFEYLLRLWENVRELTLRSTAPALVYEEGSLVKRSIRDLYSREIDAILVAGEEGYREAKDFMRMLMPSHAKNVKPYKEPEPVFIGYQVERQLAAMFSPQVTLKSGGYIVINQTEALVSIDVNSGKATREHNIEDTALKTNLEAAEEIARQLRLRDLAGLIVIDFIDMDERRNNRLVERRLKEALRNDRARIQVGRISHFGLLEMSRQRLRTGMLEGSTKPCPMCQGTGMVRSVESVALDILRSIEDRLITDGVVPLVATTAVDVALYILNQKRAHLNDIQQRYQIPITVTADEDMHISQFVIERAAEGEIASGGGVVVHMDWAHHPEAVPAPAAAPAAARAAEGEGDQARRRSRRRRRGRRQPDGTEAQRPARAERPEPDDADEAEDGRMVADAPAEETRAAEAHEDSARKGPRRRGRRGGRRGRSGQRPERAGEEAGRRAEGDAAPPSEGEARQNGAGRKPRSAESPKEDDAHQPRHAAERVLEAVDTGAETAAKSSEAHAETRAEPEAPRRRGWWQR